jgi:hypothetical protein
MNTDVLILVIRINHLNKKKFNSNSNGFSFLISLYFVIYLIYISETKSGNMVYHRFLYSPSDYSRGFVGQHGYAIKKHAIHFLTEVHKHSLSPSHNVLPCEALFNSAIQP